MMSFTAINLYTGVSANLSDFSTSSFEKVVQVGMYRFNIFMYQTQDITIYHIIYFNISYSRYTNIWVGLSRSMICIWRAIRPIIFSFRHYSNHILYTCVISTISNAFYLRVVWTMGTTVILRDLAATRSMSPTCRLYI